jgi:hypothetical protein
MTLKATDNELARRRLPVNPRDPRILPIHLVAGGIRIDLIAVGRQGQPGGNLNLELGRKIRERGMRGEGAVELPGSGMTGLGEISTQQGYEIPWTGIVGVKAVCSHQEYSIGRGGNEPDSSHALGGQRLT